MGHIHKGLYRFVTTVQQHDGIKEESFSTFEQTLNNVEMSTTVDVDLWHRRLGHPY